MDTQTAPGGEQPQTATPITTPDATQTPSTPPPSDTTPATPPVAAPEKKPDAETSQPTVDELLASVDITKMSDAQLSDIDSGDPARIRAAVLAASGVKEAPAPPKPTEQPPETPQGDDLKRISLKAIKSPEERAAVAQAVQLVREGKHETFAAALAEVFKLNKADATATPPANPDAPPASTPPAVDTQIQEIETKIATLTAERKAARESFDYDKSEELGDQIADLKLDLRDAKREAASKAEAAKGDEAKQQQWEADEAASRDRALTKYGEKMTDPDSAFADYIEVEIALAERKNDHILSQPDWPEKIADRVNAKYFNGKEAAHSTSQPPSQIPPAPPPGVRLPGSPVGNGAQTVALTAAAAAAELAKMPDDLRFAALERAQLALERDR